MDKNERDTYFEKLCLIGSSHMRSLGYHNRPSVTSAVSKLAVGARTHLEALGYHDISSKRSTVSKLSVEARTYLETLKHVPNQKQDRTDRGTASRNKANSKKNVSPNFVIPESRKGCHRQPKRNLHPDLEPDGDSYDDEHDCMGCENSKRIEGSCEGERGDGSVAGEKMLTRLKKHVDISNSVKRQDKKRKADYDEDMEEGHKVPKMLGFRPDFVFEPPVCSTPVPKNFMTNSLVGSSVGTFRVPLFHLPETKSRTPQRNKALRLIPIEDLSDSVDELIPQHLNGICSEDKDHTVKVDELFHSGGSENNQEDEGALNRTFTVDQRSKSPMFTPKSLSPENSLHDVLLPTLSPPLDESLQLLSPKSRDPIPSVPSTSREPLRKVSKPRDFFGRRSISFSPPLSIEAATPSSPQPPSTSHRENNIQDPTELSSWCVTMEDNCYYLTGNIIRGPVSQNSIKVKAVSIALRRSPYVIEMTDGTVFKLVDQFNGLKIPGISYHFRRGFPVNWREVLSTTNSRASTPRESINSTFEVESKSKVKKFKGANTSFFDLPDGKGTPEAPLSYKDLRQTRRSGRTVIPPLAWWRNQRVLINPRTKETTVVEGSKNALTVNVVYFEDFES